MDQRTTRLKALMAVLHIPMQHIADTVLNGELLEAAQEQGQGEGQKGKGIAGTLYKMQEDEAFVLLHVIVFIARKAIRIEDELEAGSLDIMNGPDWEKGDETNLGK